MSRSIEIAQENPHLAEHLMSNLDAFSPLELARIFPEYSSYTPLGNPTTPDIWIHPRAQEKFSRAQRDNKLSLFLFSGPAGAGKETVGKQALLMHTDLTRVITTADRKPRTYPEPEVPGFDYHFVSPLQFSDMINKGRFIEYVQQVQGRYGTTTKAIRKALVAGTPLLTADITGWSKFSQKIPQIFKKVELFSVFMLLNGGDYNWYQNTWLKRLRPDSYMRRSAKTAAELEHAPHLADFILLNHPDDNNPGQEAAKQLVSLIKMAEGPKNTLLEKLIISSGFVVPHFSRVVRGLSRSSQLGR